MSLLETLEEISKSSKPIVASAVESSAWQIEMVSELKKFSPLPHVTLSWPWPDQVFDNVELRDELARVTRSVGVSLRWAGDDRIREAIAAKPEVLALHWSPFHDKFEGEKWTDAEAWGARELAYLSFFYQKCVAAKAIIGDQQVVMIFDHEKHWPSDSEIVVRKLSTFYHIAKYVFGGDVVWYNWGQWGLGTGASPPREWSSMPRAVPSDCAAMSLYHEPGSMTNDARIRETAAHTDKPLMVWVSIGACYEERPYTPIGVRRRSADVIATPQLGQTWRQGYLLYDEFPARFPAKFGPVDRIKYVCFWPELLDPNKPAMRIHLLEFFRGALEIRHE